MIDFLEQIPVAFRRQVAFLAADIIDQAASVGNERWGLTPYLSGIRVNVGWTEILTAHQHHTRLIVDGARARAAVLPEGVSLTDGDDGRGFYPTIPGSLLAGIPHDSPEHFGRTIEALRPALTEAIRAAARRRAGRGVKSGHSQEAVFALASFVGRQLPAPGYVLEPGREANTGSASMDGALRRVPYLFLWNPKKDSGSFSDYERVLREAGAGHAYVTRWICPSKQPRPGDVAILQRTGSKDNGVFAKGFVTGEPFEGDDGIRVVMLKFDSFLPVGREIPREEIIATAKHEGTWSPMASGNIIPEPIHQAIQTIWGMRTSTKDTSEQDEVAVSGTLETERDALTQERIGQAAFRVALMKYWGRCAVTGVLEPAVLRASHIKPWHSSSNEERLDPFNGLLLAAHIDALFDVGLITFEMDGRIRISPLLAEEDLRQLGILPTMRLRLVATEHQTYLQFHHEVFRFGALRDANHQQ